ncbi:MAG TPA: 16S rRNA (guanine(966)-N(2))-methyltransferase RsmD [Polyangia bacterium]|jgi:16S rRNA (guanine966-N2)-methyltransferase|nr:16S rRNA (guanine(966)-N(2))-methyltransferase RsmD [Polyangia bacterium]
MRLTGGSDRGRRLVAPRGTGTRPTGAKVREAMFNILGPPPDGAILDLYAGTGALGLEALSRGAARAVFVERDPHALSALRRNLRELECEDRALVVGADVATALRRLGAQHLHFSWVFLDPPYRLEVEAVLAELGTNDLLVPCSVVVVEHDRRHRPPGSVSGSVGGLFLADRREYGDTELSFYRGGRS